GHAASGHDGGDGARALPPPPRAQADQVRYGHVALLPAVAAGCAGQARLRSQPAPRQGHGCGADGDEKSGDREHEPLRGPRSLAPRPTRRSLSSRSTLDGSGTREHGKDTVMDTVMMHGRRPLLFLVLALCLVVAHGEALARDADIIISQKADVETFDPAQSNNTSTHNVTINLFDTLVRLSDDGRDFVGELAESWKLVDQTTWQFKLRRGVKFHNG